MSARKLAELLADQPDLTEAACRGQWALFDPAAEDEDHAEVEARHHRAAAICSRCPALAACRDWAERIPPKHRPPGVLAEIIPQARPGRPHERKTP
ncbi:WhiB family transcriptional regulator [Gordonia sp. PP30]|uniref:WhiB family transcriptional regulator n=1 Tax=Gordonia sp. PP30 TaxID=2935861 RepID=UPI0020001F76|nr:WhiB family transcriptional regulator [Gordonia sp. PP30]UQE74631.1 WhiB family transcriptional regulator [Gordonia sp. PP30]